MTSTNHTTVAARVGQCLAATALTAGLAFGATPIAGAKPYWDGWGYSNCLSQIDTKLPQEDFDKQMKSCCEFFGGTWKPKPDGDTRPNCEPPAETENVPQEPGPTEPPPVLDPGQTGPSNPLIPTPRGPNTGTLG